MMRLAMKDAYNQQDLAQKAKLQVDLFQKAQEFAKEVGVQELKAKQFANILNEATRKAQYSRAMMFQAASSVRALADQTIRAISPMKCVGLKCGVVQPNQFVNMGVGMNAMPSVMANQPVVMSPQFRFSEKPQGNLRK